MGDSTGNTYFSGGASRFPRSRQRSNSDEQIIIPHFLAPLPCEYPYQPYLGAAENAQNISVQFMHSYISQDTTQLDSDILQRRLTFDDDSTSVAYPESSQRTTSHSSSPYATEAASFSEYDLATLHATQTFRRGSWPSHSQTEYSPWMQSPTRIVRSPVSEPPESTSDESYQDSDVEEATQMSPMMNQFQIHSSRNIDLPPQHIYHVQALQPAVMTFQLSETMMQPVDDPENALTSRSPLDMSIIEDDESESTYPSPSSTFLPPSLISLGGAMLQGLGMRFQHPGEKAIQTSQFRVPMPTSNSSVSFPSPHSPTSSGAGDRRPPGFKQQKKSKMHQCQQCKKLFPRPSGLATHMNTHSGAKPYKCIVANCDKSFAVRSNAKRHLRTHGINPSSPEMLSGPRFTVGFEEPMVTQVHNTGRQPSRYRWIPHNPSSHEHEWPRQGSSSSAVDGVSRTGIMLQASMSSTSSSTLSNGSDDGYDELSPSSAADVHRSQGDHTNTNEFFSGAYPIHREHFRRG